MNARILIRSFALGLLTVGLAIPSSSPRALAVEQAADHAINLADGALRLTAPESWVRKKPANNVIEHEFAVPASKGDPADGRLTVTGAGGTVQANLDRWIGQFSQPDGGDSKDKAKTKNIESAGQDVHLLDVSGTFEDRPGGPFAGGQAVQREKYRMLAAIIVTKKMGSYFVKFYGPEKTVADNEKAFQKMIEGMEKK